MSYADLLAREGVESYYLVVIKPRRVVANWTLVSGTIYSAPFTLGDVVAVHDGDVALTLATSATLIDGGWYFDVEAGLLYVTGLGDPADNNVIVTYEMHVSTKDEVIFHRDPGDTSTREVYFEPIIVRAPDIVASVSEQSFGFMPSQSTRITLSNTHHGLEEHIYDSSFSKADASVYHGLGPLKAENLKLVFTGICSEVDYEDDRVSIKLFDATQSFDKEFRFGSSDSYFPTSIFSGKSTDPNYVARPFRAVFGRVEGVIPVNVDYNADAPSTSNNRRWVAAKPHAADSLALFALAQGDTLGNTNTRTYVKSTVGFEVGDAILVVEGGFNDFYSVVTGVGANYLDYTYIPTVVSFEDDRIYKLHPHMTKVPTGAVCTTTRTYVMSTVGFAVGDSIELRSVPLVASGPYGKVTAIGAGYVEHTAFASAASPGDYVLRPPVAAVYIRQDEVVYEAVAGIHYTPFYNLVSPLNTPPKEYGFTFTSTLETDLGMPRTLSPLDLVWATVYGPKNRVSIDNQLLGSDSTTTGNLTNGVVILYSILTSNLGISPSEIDGEAFQALEPLYPQDLSFAVPSESRGNFPTYKDLIADICQSLLVKVYKNPDNKWTVAPVGPIAAPTRAVSLDETEKGSMSYRFDYSDTLSEVIVEYGEREVSPTGEAGTSVLRVISTNDTAKHLHKISKQKTFKSLLLSEADALTLADRLSYVFGDRAGKMRLRLRDSYLDTDLSEVLEVNAEKLPGFSYAPGTEYTRGFAVTETTRTLRDVTIELDDQKGIEDNAGDW